MGVVWAPIWEDLAPLGELWGSQEPQIGCPRGTKIPLDPSFGAKRRFRSNLGWILDGFGSSDASQTGPRRALKPPRTCPKLSPEPTQYSAFRIMYYPSPITLLPGPAGWAQPLNPPCACRTGRVKRDQRMLAFPAGGGLLADL